MPRATKPAKARAATRARLDVDVRRGQLLDLGIEVFSQRAYDAVSIDDIAHAAGVSKGLLYHYFPTKRDFYAAALRESARRLLACTTTDPAAPSPEQVRAGLEAYFDYVEHFGPAYVALLRGGIGSDPAVAHIVEQTRQQFLERLLAGIGIAPPPPPLLRAALRGWIGFVEAASLDWVERRDVDRAALLALLGGVLRGVLDAHDAGGARAHAPAAGHRGAPGR